MKLTDFKIGTEFYYDYPSNVYMCVDIGSKFIVGKRDVGTDCFTGSQLAACHLVRKVEHSKFPSKKFPIQLQMNSGRFLYFRKIIDASLYAASFDADREPEDCDDIEAIIFEVNGEKIILDATLGGQFVLEFP